MPLDPEDFLVDWERKVEQQTAMTTELSRRMQDTRATAESRGGEAVVTVDQSGGLAALELTDRAMRLSPEELSRTILETSRRAQARLAEQMTEIVTGLYGAGSDTAAFIGGAYAEQFPTPPEDDDTEERRR
ncbi:YbaB/EbfC family nucleoid-associated protein [Paractinoplanes lichenicola]|uniref:YbaB/EbfC family nucleoid-associated protein n=1 Tax=Paractinoplanes lichenicola TaxID=2802976 RepID=A0ABS1VUQ6_9ACTN|nr:YbaB/EbfC family nucleoid-associated protein [Actinoplanes lichenicola]MBL7258195.1 YbaB/EbfC family nucleoid-associated protein [Actinoplanes lichenicola]